MTPKQLLRYCGSSPWAAVCAHVTVQTINNWLAKGMIPIDKQAFIQLRTKGALKADKIKEFKSS